MFGIRYRKATPTQYVLHYAGGRLVREGAGLSFYYFAPAAVLAVVPMESTNIPFVFQESTADFQMVTVQGQLTYRIADPRRAAAMLDFTVDGRGRYVTDQHEKLPERLVYALQTLVRAELQNLPLPAALTAGEALSAAIAGRLAATAEVTRTGVEILGVAILGLRPTPDMAKALEAAAREALNRESDEAIFARRNAALEQERRIRESELATELAVQARQREIAERGLAGDIALETQRAALTEQRAANERQEADSRAYALRALLGPLDGLDWRTLAMLQSGGGDARQTIAMAFQELASNAQKIGELHVSPDLLQSLLAGRPERR